jgi:hypothetical protein
VNEVPWVTQKRRNVLMALREYVGPGFIIAAGAVLLFARPSLGSAWDLVFFATVLLTVVLELVACDSPDASSSGTREATGMTVVQYTAWVTVISSILWTFARIAPE